MTWRARGVEAAILLVALAVRLPAIAAGLPYMTYVDEGHVAHHSGHLISAATWEPTTYSYPTLPFYLVAGAALAWSPVYHAIHGRSLREDLSPFPAQYYDIVEPPDLLVAARSVTLLFSLGVVLLTGRLARAVGGSRAGWLAAGLAALVPALVARSAIANVNPQAAFFVLLALLLAERARRAPDSRPLAALAGAAAALAGVSKYPAVLVAAPVALALLLAPGSRRQRLGRVLIAGGTAVAAAVVAMPALLLRSGAVRAGLEDMDTIYAHQVFGSYWDQMVRRAEWDLPLAHPEVGLVFVMLAGAGILLALLDARQRPATAGWLLFMLLTAAIVAPYGFRAFRNLLALVPLACATIGLLYVRLRRLAPPRGRLAADLAAALLPLLLYAAAVRDHLATQRSLVDSRERAFDVLAERAPGRTVLVLEELAFLPSRLAALRADVTVLPWSVVRQRLDAPGFDFIVLGDLRRNDGRMRIRRGARERLLEHYEPIARWGFAPTPEPPGAARPIHQIVEILMRRGTPPSKRELRPAERGSDTREEP